MVKFSGQERTVELIVIYNYLEELWKLQVHQVLPLDQPDKNSSVYGSYDCLILVDCLILLYRFESFSTFKRFNWTVQVFCIISFKIFDNFCPL